MYSKGFLFMNESEMVKLSFHLSALNLFWFFYPEDGREGKKMFC